MTDIGVGSWPARRARMAPDSIAFRQGDRSLTYAHLAERVDSLAAGLVDLGVRHGDRVAYLGSNDIRTFETLFAVGRLGALFVPLNTRLSARETTYLLDDSGSRVLVYGDDSAELAATARADAGSIAHMIALDGAGVDALDYESLAGTGQSLVVDSEVTLADAALVLYTSGTTGRPKGAVLTHGNITFNTVNQLAQTDVLSGDVALCTAPLFHVVGLGQVTLPTLFKGGTVVVAPKFDAQWLLRSVAELGVNSFSAVPTMLQMLCDHPDFAAADLGTLRYIVYGGSPVLARVAKAWLERGVDLRQGYGMTEAAPGVLLAMPDGAAVNPVSAGVPQFFVDVALLGVDGDVAGAAGTGELMVRGPNVFGGYLGRPDDTTAAFTDGWFRSGDIVRIDEQGWGFVVDRAKDMIISGGENIYPAEVEAAIAGMPDVADCAVVGVADDRWGEVGYAVVVPMPGHSVDADDVRQFLDGRLARFKIPKYLMISDELPRNATGKIVKSELRRQASGQLANTTQEKQ